MSTSIVLPVHNKAWLLPTVLDGIVKNASPDVRELVIVLDGCTDGSDEIAAQFDTGEIEKKLVITSDVWEVLASNAGYRTATGDFIVAVQDDMVIQHPWYDRHMLKPFAVVRNLLGVTARNAQDERVTDDGRLVWLNGAGRDANSPAGVLYIRDVIVRGPIMWDHQRLEQLGYLCEDFAPIYADDYDLCLRAWRQGYVVGAYRTNYLSPDSWATTRNHSPEKQAVWQWSCNKNEALVMERHRDILNGPKHDQDVAI